MEENKECRQCANPNEKGLHTCVDRTELVESIKKIQQEIYEKKYHSSSSTYTHHIYKREMDDDTQTLKLINKSFYDMAKLADKPIST